MIVVGLAISTVINLHIFIYRLYPDVKCSLFILKLSVYTNFADEQARGASSTRYKVSIWLCTTYNCSSLPGAFSLLGKIRI